VDIRLKDASTNLQILNDKEKPLRTTFNKLLNRDEDEAVLIQDSFPVSPLSEKFRKDSLITNNPVLKELELKRKANEAAEEAAIKQGLPKIGVGLDYVVVKERGDMSLADNGKDVLMPMVSVSIPLFRKKYKAAIKEKQLMQESFTLQKDDYSNRLITDYENILFEISRQQQLLDLYDRQIATAEQTLNLLFSAYGNSGKEFEEVLRMQQQLLQYDKMKTVAGVNYQIAVAKLKYVTAYEW
jgi:outer membrane protein TolC